MHLELRAHHDDGAAAVVDSFAQQILAEAALLTPEQVGQRLELVIVAALNGAAPPAVVYQGIHCFLEHPFLVADDNFRCAQVHKPFQPVVPVDDPPVEVV